MELFLANDNDSKQFEQIKLWINKHMDGSVASRMKESGVFYPINFGVSIVHLRRYAAELTTSHRMPVRLWNSDIRECMLLATLLFRPEQIEKQLPIIADRITNIELAEQFGFNIGYKCARPSELFSEWLASEKEFIQIAALLSLATSLQRGLTLQEENLSSFFKAASALSVSSLSMQRAMVRFLTNLIKNKALAEEVKALAKSWSLDDNQAKQAVAREIFIEMEYS